MQRFVSPVTLYNVEMKWYAFNILLSRCKDGCLENRISSGDKLCCARCCCSGMFIPDLGSRIPVPESKNRNKREGWKKICRYTFFCSHKFHKIVNYFIFEMVKKKFEPTFKKLSLSSQKYGFGSWDPGSEIRHKEKTCSGSRIPDSGVQGSKRQRIPDPGPVTLHSAASTILHCTVYKSYKKVKLDQNYFFLVSWLWKKLAWNTLYSVHYTPFLCRLPSDVLRPAVQAKNLPGDEEQQWGNRSSL
jgi:hypothetical protein